MAPIKKQSEGWGVAVATVEITDVRILSRSLFENLQCQFMEENNKKAELERLEVANGIWIEQQEHSLRSTKREANANKVERFAQMAENLQKKKQELDTYKKRLEL